MNYKKKYNKYKKKYLNLKHNGGNTLDKTLTQKFIKRKDIFNQNEKEECLKSVKYTEEYVTNKKFSKFNQLYYHAGDYDDLNEYAIKPINDFYKNKKDKKIDMKNNLFKDLKVNYFEKYSNSKDNIKNTLFFYFEKYKKANIIVIQNNELKVFLPFSNSNFRNDYYNSLYFNEEDKRLLKEYKRLKEIENLSDFDYRNLKKIKWMLKKNVYEFTKNIRKKYMDEREKWVANNCILRNDYPEFEGDKLTSEYKNILLDLLKERKIPDVIFFLNVRDFPLLKRDLTESYNHIYDSKNKKMDDKFIFDSYRPILSRSSTDEHADIPLPTEDDINRITNNLYPDKCKNIYSKENISDMELEWGNKIDKAIFLGSATGCGITTETNMRLKSADISYDNPDLLHAGITNWNARVKKYEGQSLEIINPKKFRFKLADRMNQKEKSKYKYILIIDGHVSAFRLSFDLSLNSVILLVDSPYYIWYSKMLVPYEHYIPIKKDLSDLIEKINWCKNNDKECKKIANKAKKFYETYLSKEGLYDYFQKILTDISKL
jgi:hypothetical protein